jgi:hypothetical protein
MGRPTGLPPRAFIGGQRKKGGLEVPLRDNSPAGRRPDPPNRGGILRELVRPSFLPPTKNVKQMIFIFIFVLFLVFRSVLALVR